MHDLPCIYGVNLNSLLIVDIYKQFWYAAVWLEAVEEITTHVVLKKYFVQDFLLILKSLLQYYWEILEEIFSCY